MQEIIDIRVTKAHAKRVLDSLERWSVNVFMARRDLETKSRYYNIYYQAGMVSPIVTYASEL